MADFARGGLQFLRNQVQERRFTAAVRADNRDAVALENFHREVGDEFRPAIVGERKSLDLQHALAEEFRLGKAEFEVPFVREAFAVREFRHRLDLGLHHRGLRGLVAETLDDLLELFLLLRLVFLRALRDFLFFGNCLA